MPLYLLRLLWVRWNDKVGNFWFFSFFFFSAVLGASFGGQFDIMFVSGVEIKGRKG